MPRVTDANPAFLSCHVENGALVLSHAGTPLGLDELEVKLVEAVVAITDFEHDGTRYRVNAFTRASDGSLTPWERTSEGARSPVLRGIRGQRVEINVVVMSTSYAPAGEATAREGEATARELAAFDEDPAYTPAAVKVRLPDPDDIKPGD
jgi:hypothetical protein